MIRNQENESDEISNKSVPNKLKYLLVGDKQKAVIVFEYPPTAPSNIIKDAKTLFDKVVHSVYCVNEERNKIKANGGVYYFTIKREKYFFFLFTEKEFNERLAFNFIDQTSSNEVLDLVNKKGSLTDEGQQRMKLLITLHGESTSSDEAEISQKSENAREYYQSRKVVNSCPEDKIEDIHIKIAEEFKHEDEIGHPVLPQSHLTNKHPDEERKKIILWRNIKLYSIVICIGICILLYLIIPFSVQPSESILGPKPISSSPNITVKVNNTYNINNTNNS